MKIKYHITPKKNISSIMTNGLKTDFYNCMSHCYDHFIKHYGKKPIFLTDDPARLVEEQLTLEWVKKNDPFVLSVDVSGLDLIHEHACVDWLPEPIAPDYTWISIEDICASRLKLLGKVKYKSKSEQQKGKCVKLCQ